MVALTRSGSVTATLAIDTAGSFCSVAIFKSATGAIAQGKGSTFHAESLGAGDHFEQLPHLVGEVCGKAGIGTLQLTGIIVGTGPGSFTGIRIGMSYAKGLAWALRTPLLGCSSFLGCAVAVARNLPPRATEIYVVADARREEVFLGRYKLENDGGIVEFEAPRIRPASEAAHIHGLGEIVVTTQKSFTLGGADLEEVGTSALGFLSHPGPFEPFTIQGLDAVEPAYLRAVSAKTIAERMA
jgi:tRNA threonylcarbamoyl adenosine modification protein YeaZ